jgi:enamine deaminase RidA (YjgF/YER057c/UK114 family)
MSAVRRHNPPTVHPPLGKYHHATVHPLGNGLKRLVMAGQVGIKPDGQLAGDLGAQIEQAYDNLLAVLASEGMSAENLVKITYFTTEKTPEALKLSREIRGRKLGDANPSSTYLVIAGLAGPDLKVEIEGEAVGEG